MVSVVINLMVDYFLQIFLSLAYLYETDTTLERLFLAMSPYLTKVIIILMLTMNSTEYRSLLKCLMSRIKVTFSASLVRRH